MKKGNIKHNYVRLHEINSINGVNVECLPSLYSIYRSVAKNGDLFMTQPPGEN